MKNKKLLLKRALALTVVMVMALSFNCFALSAQKKTDVPHEYKVLPGSDEWAYMSVEQRLASCKVTQAEVEAMTTEALIETVVNYPYLVNIFAYDTIETGIKMVSNHFPGIEELFARNDAVKKMECYYNTLVNAERKGVEIQNAGFKMSAVVNLLQQAQDDELFSTSGQNTTRYMNTYVLTPSGRSVTAVLGYTWSEKITVPAGLTLEQHLANIHNNYLTSYPGIYSVMTENPSYNCHSYAWHDRSASNSYWINDPTRYVTDESYSASSASLNDIVTYREGSIYVHSGVVTGFSSGRVMVTSKWGALRGYVHTVSNCPYIVDSGIARTVEYWELNPGYTANYQ